MSNEIFDKSYKALNKAQKQAVDTIEGPVMVNAGPGTGKTQILTLRIANILRQTDTQPENILALTFTNSGVFSMRERLHDYIDDISYRINIYTFHAFCENVIKEFSFYFPSFEYARVIDDLEKIKIIESIITSGNFQFVTGFHNEYQKVKDIADAISNIKSEGISSEDYIEMIPVWEKELLDDPEICYRRKYKEYNVGDIKPAEKEKIDRKIKINKELSDIYIAYQDKLKEKKLYDFSDMILSVISELKNNENLKSELQEKYQYILVDEHQDTNSGQNELIELLTDAEHLNRRPNIFTVGDEKQSIYRFQGASLDTFNHFHKLFDDISHINLTENYRSTPTILEASYEVIKNSIADPIKLNSNTDFDQKIRVGNFSNYKFELLYLAEEIKMKIDAGVDPQEIAVLFRANKHIEDIKTVLSYYKIPFTIHAKSSLFDDVDISNIILLLKVLDDPTDQENIGKSLFINFLELDGYDVIKILNKRYFYQKHESRDLLDILADKKVLGDIGIQNIDTFIIFAKNIKKGIVDIRNSDLLDFLKSFLENVGFTKYMLKHDLSRDKLLKINKLFDQIKKQKTKGDFGISDFIKMIDAYDSYHLDIESSNSDIEVGVELMTAHGSKGKEFEYVYLINTTAKNWENKREPHKIATPIKTYKGDLNDERRLFYVSMTRAKKEISIYSSKNDWEGKEQERSRFINEIPEYLIEDIDTNKFEIDNIDNFKVFVEPQNNKKTIYDTDFISKIFFDRGLTVTALNNFLECPVKYFYKNLVQIPSGYSKSMRFGELMHTSLEKFFMESRKAEKVLLKDELISIFNREIDNSEFVGKELEKYRLRGADSLSGWFDNNQEDLHFEVNLEQKIKRDLILNSDEIIKLNGKLDKIEFLESSTEGPIRIIDYKTGKSFSEKTKDQKMDYERQLIFYYLLLENWKEGRHEIQDVFLDFIEPNKKGKYERHSILISQENIDNLKKEINNMSEQILSGDFLKMGCNKKECEWCKIHNQ